MDTLRYILGVFIVIGLPPGLAWWFFVHPFTDFWRRRGVAMTMTVMTVFVVGSMWGLFLVRDPLMGRDLGANQPLVAVGIILFCAAAFIAMKRKKHLPIRILAGVPELQADEEKRGELLDQGIYGRIRHPRYVEIIFFTFSYAAISNHVGPYVVAGLTIPVIHLLVLVEERELIDRFVEAYREYRERVPRYIPRRAP